LLFALAYVEAHNENAKPYRWMKNADEILHFVRRRLVIPPAAEPETERCTFFRKSQRPVRLVTRNRSTIRLDYRLFSP
jgi:hypothetical protein